MLCPTSPTTVEQTRVQLEYSKRPVTAKAFSSRRPVLVSTVLKGAECSIAQQIVLPRATPAWSLALEPVTGYTPFGYGGKDGGGGRGWER